MNAVTGLAFVNTDLLAAHRLQLITWLESLNGVRARKPKFVGLLTGAVAGLATVTPAAGFVSLNCAVVIGIASGIVCYLAVDLKNRMKKWDDALDVWGDAWSWRRAWNYFTWRFSLQKE